MTISHGDFAHFESLVLEDTRHTEIECGNYLHHAASFLLPATTIRTATHREERNYFGPSDFVVSGTLLNDRNQEEDAAYIWELKAPQCYLFEFDDNKNRCRPTADFIRAENQLIHYVHQAAGDQNFRYRFNIVDHRNVRPGGIIIGRSQDRMLKGNASSDDTRKANLSLSIRENLLYAAQRIRILTWDRILRFVQPP